MSGVCAAMGRIAAASWLALAALTAAGILFGADTVVINLVMATFFAAIAGLLAWRQRVVGKLGREFPGHPLVRSLLRSELATMGLAVAIGILLVCAAGYRVFFERLPVFG
ncbi:hypothetical protein [Pseudomonas sp. CGJS7]|uniref:hypothetical protein n=1 Tax=Pseudomonas sp. CGJS7 TaxID=3109348 RepID=UPI00300BAB87